MNEILEQFISQILIGTGLLTSLAVYFKTIIDKKQINNKLAKTINDRQDTQLNLLAKKLDETEKTNKEIIKKLTFLYDNIKNSIFHRTLEMKLRKQLDTIMKINNLKDSEFINLLNNGLNAFLAIINDILLYDFEVSTEQLNDISLQHLDNLTHLINHRKLKIQNSLNYIKELKKDILLPEMKLFTFEFCNLKKLENGTRREKLTNISIEITKKIINKSIYLYNKERE